MAEMLADKFGWDWTIDGDISVDAFGGVESWEDIDWDLAIWGNPGYAKWAKEHKENRSSVSVIPTDWINMLAASTDRYSALLARVPYSVLRAAEVVAMASGRVVRSVDGIAGQPWCIYSAERGVWTMEDAYQTIIRIYSSGFGEAMNRAADLAEHIAEKVLYNPIGSKPGSGATDAEKKKYAAAEELYKSQLEKAKRIRKFEQSIALTQSTWVSIKAEWSALVSTSQEEWDSNMNWIVLKDRALSISAILDSKGSFETVYDFPHSPEYMSTMSLDVSWNEMQRALAGGVGGGGVADSEWYRGVAKVLPDAGVREYLQKRWGAALIGSPGIVGKSMVWQYGKSNTAKSTLQECIAGEHGVFAPYAVVSGSEVLTEMGLKSGKTERFLAYARGKRFVIMSELNPGVALNESGMKTMTGGESVQGTAKYANSVSYHFSATMFMASNHAPSVASGDQTAIDRIDVVPFTHVLWLQAKNPVEWAAAGVESRADPQWQDKILGSARERAYILAWVLDGLFKFAAEGIGELPEAMKESKDDFVESEKTLSQKLVDWLLVGGPSTAPALRLYSDDDWDKEGLLANDGLSVDELYSLLDFVGPMSGLVGASGVTLRTKKAVARILNDKGGNRKRVKKDGGTYYAFTRIKEVSPALYRVG